MKKEICLATNNRGKLREYREILAPAGFLVYCPADLNVVSEPEEDGNTYRANAFIKAKALKEKVPFSVIADDSGLEVECLNGFPGLISGRYAEGFPSYREAWADLNQRIGGNPNRAAKFHCCICLLETLNSTPLYFEADCPGEILKDPLGEAGFGFDPIFFSQELKKGLGEATEEEKNAISHRGKAIRKLLVYLAI